MDDMTDVYSHEILCMSCYMALPRFTCQTQSGCQLKDYDFGVSQYKSHICTHIQFTT